MRKPSIHITEEVLDNLIQEWFVDNSIKIPSTSLVKKLMTRGKNYQILNRTIEVNNKKEFTKVSRITQSSTGDASLFVAILSMVRIARKHVMMKRVREGDADWVFMKDGASQANEFYQTYAEDFKSKDDAFRVYIEMFLDLMEGPYSIRKITSMHERIYSRYSASKDIAECPDPESVSIMHQIYQQKIFEKTSNSFNYEKNPEQYIHFVKANYIAVRLGITSKQYILAQFESLDWTGGIPYPQQLSNSKAEERAIRWMAQNNVKKSKVNSKELNTALSNLKKLTEKYENNLE